MKDQIQRGAHRLVQHYLGAPLPVNDSRDVILVQLGKLYLLLPELLSAVLLLLLDSLDLRLDLLALSSHLIQLYVLLVPLAFVLSVCDLDCF